MKKNKRPKEDPSLNLSRKIRSPAKKKGSKKRKGNGKAKKNQTSKKNVDRNNKPKAKQSVDRNNKPKSKPKQEVEDLSDVRTGLIWPWIASITIAGEVTCTGFIISSRIVITATRCFPSLDSNR